MGVWSSPKLILPLQGLQQGMTIILFSKVSIKMGDLQQHYNVHKSVHFNYNIYN